MDGWIASVRGGGAEPGEGIEIIHVVDYWRL